MQTDINVVVVRYGDRKYLMMRYKDPITGKQIARSTGTTNQKQAERAAAKWEAELREGRYAPKNSISWEAFRDRFEEEVLPALAANTDNLYKTTFNSVERIVNPKHLRDVNAERISFFQSKLRAKRLSEHTIRCYLAHLRAALSWAKSMGLIHEVPVITFPKRAKKLRMMKGRPLTEDEFELLLKKTSVVVGEEGSELWRRLLTGLWFSGLRLSESINLSWDNPDQIKVDFTGRRPMLHIPSELEKGNEDRMYPVAPEFAEFLLKTSVAERVGPVFPLVDRYGKQSGFRMDWVSKVISKIGKEAKIKVGASKRTKKPKYASAHDLRRSFGDRWARLVMPQTLRELMRHASIETTLRYYVGFNAEKTADILWEIHESKKA